MNKNKFFYVCLFVLSIASLFYKAIPLITENFDV